MAVASLVLGIVSIIFAFTGFLAFIGAITGIVGIILGALAMKNLKAENQPTGMATGGLVTSIIGASLALILYLACVACMSTAGKELNKVTKDPAFQKSLQDMTKELKKLDKVK